MKKAAHTTACSGVKTRVETIVAEITNTPWGERHAYVLPASAGTRDGEGLRFRFGKQFHVSPFMPMDQEYDWTFGEPGEALCVRMVNRGDGARVFDAALALERREISGTSLAWALARHPFATLNVLRRIHWQAYLPGVLLHELLGTLHHALVDILLGEPLGLDVAVEGAREGGAETG